MLSLPVNCTDIMEQSVIESFCLFLYFFRELNFKEIEAYNRLQNVDCVLLPNIKDQVSGVSIDCVSLPNIKDQVNGLSIDHVSLPNIKDQVNGLIDCITLPNIKDQMNGLKESGHDSCCSW